MIFFGFRFAIIFPQFFWSDTQVVEGTGFENQQGIHIPPEFKSLSLRHLISIRTLLWARVTLKLEMRNKIPEELDW